MFVVLSLMFFAFAWCERALIDIHATDSKVKSMSPLLCDNNISSNVAYHILSVVIAVVVAPGAWALRSIHKMRQCLQQRQIFLDADNGFHGN